MVILTVTLLIDTSLVKINDLIDKYFIPIQSKLIIFSFNSLVCLVLQLFLITFVMNSLLSSRLSNTPKIRAFYVISLISFTLLAFFVGLLVFQEFYYHYYDTWVIISIVSISYGTCAVLIFWLALLFFSWYRSSRDFIVLLYSLSMSLIAFHLISTAVFVDAKLSSTQYRVGEFGGGSGDTSGSRYPFLENTERVSSFVSFFSIWMTTAILMNSYREKLIRSVSYWVLLVLPLGYFIITFTITYFPDFLNDILVSSLQDDPVGISIKVTAFLSLSKPIGGLIFAAAFWKMSKIIGYERNMKISMLIAGWGIFFIFSADQALTQTVSHYPPFGITTVTIMNIASYLLVLGIFNSATLVSANNSLRTSIRKHTLKLLNPIGRAEMEREIQRAVTKISEDKEIAKISEEESFEFDENELKEYLREVINLKREYTSK